MKKRWKSLIAWILIITIIGGYGNTALAAGLSDGIFSETGNGTEPKASIAADAGTGSQEETGGTGETGTEIGSTSGTGTETGDTDDTGESGETDETVTEDGSTGNEGDEVSQDPADTAEADKSLETEEELEAATLTAQAGTYEPYWENGNYSNLVVLVDFADSTHDHGDKVFGQCFKEDPADTFKYFNGDEENPRGMRQYLYNISYGQLRVENIFPQYNQAADTITPYTLSHEASYYVDNEATMVTEVIERLEASGQVQGNMNLHLSDPACNIVDNLNIVVAGDSSNLFIDHKTTYGGDKKVAGCLVRNYTVVKENDVYLGYSESGVIIHEFLHSLGYPDTYRQGSNSGIPIGSWDIMSTVNHRVQYPLAYLRSAYTKWFEIPQVTESQTGISLYAASKTTAETKDQQALILKTDYSDTEFFVVEYRKKGEEYVNGQYSNEYEVGIPGSGLIVYRVNTSQETNYVGTTDLLYLFRPGDSYGDDGRELGQGDYDKAHLSQEAERTSYGSSNFEDSLAEGAITYSDGKNSGIVISNVGGSAGDQITFDVTFHEEAEGVRWKTVASEKEGEVTSEAASCMDKDGNLYFILKKGGASYLYKCRDGAFTRLGTAPGGSSHKLAWYNGQLYCGYLNSNYVVKLARWNGSSWQALYTAPRDTNEFSMASDSKGVYLAYANTDGTRVYAAGYTTAGMAELGSQVAESTGYAANASIAAENGTVVVMYREAFNKNRIYVKQYSSSTKSWSNVGSQSFSANSGLVKIRGGRVYLMKNGTTYGENKSYLYVYDLKNGGSWQQVGSSFFADASIAEMDLCFVGSNPYVVYLSGSQPCVTEVKRLLDGAWANLGESVSREIVSGLNAYAFDGQIYVAYLNTVNNRVSVKTHASESREGEELLWELFPDALDYGIIEAENPFWQLVERSKNGTADNGIAAFSEKRYTDSFGSQIEEPLAKEIYNIMVDRYAKRRLIGNQEASLTNSISFTASISGGSIVQDGNYAAARQKLSHCFSLAFGAFYMDYPSVFWMNRMGIAYGIRYDGTTGKANITNIVLRPDTEYYEGASGQVASYDAAVKAAKDLIEAEMAEADADPEDRYQQVNAIHKYLCDKLTYDDAAGNDLYGDGYGYAHTSSTVFLGHNGEYKVVCEGYAKAFKVLCEQWGIPCVLVIGQGGIPGNQGPHMWNYVQMEDGNWYGMDVTWDDQTSGIRSEYFLAGSSTVGFHPGYTFIQEHVPDMQITTGEPYPFVYPELAENVYTPVYQGRVVSEAGGKWLYINEADSEEPFSDADVLRIIRRNAPKGPFAGISIIRKGSDKGIPADLVNEAALHLVRNGKLHYAFWEQTETASRVIRWELTGLRRAVRDLNGEVTAAKGTDGRWNLTCSDTELPAKSVSLMYADSRMTEFYQLLSGESKEERLPIYLYTPAGENGERILALEGYYQHIQPGELPEDELHGLFLSDGGKLETGVAYTVETSRYDWRLEYGCREDADGAELSGTVLYYTSEDELVTALDGLGIGNTNVRISSEGKEQPEAVPKELLEICASKGLNLEYVRREEEDLAYSWKLNGLKAPADGQFEDFDLRVDIRMQGEDLPIEFLERTYIQVTPGKNAPDCEEASLKLYQEGIGSRFAGAGSISLWQRKGDSLEYLRTAGRDPKDGGWVSFTLNPVSGASGNEVYILSSQSKYGWQSVAEEDGNWKVIYIENRTGKRIIGWEIIEGRRCYFDSEGYLCQGPVKVGNTWYLFGDYMDRTQGILTGYQTYPLQKEEEGTEQKPSHAYYADAGGALQKGWRKISDIWHYFSAEEASYGEELPSVQEGCWVTMGEGAGAMAGRRYYFKNNTTLLKNWQTIDKKKYFFTAEGYAWTGWYPDSSAKNAYYLNGLGQMVTGYAEITEGEAIYHCFFNGSGIRQYGWQKSGDTWHYFQTDAEAEDYGREIASVNTSGYWYKMGGNTYYFLNNTRPAAGWQTIGGGRYYFGSQGKMYTGTEKIGSVFYHFLTEEGREGILGTGLFADDGKTYYANSSGVLLRGWQKIEGIWRFFNHETGEEEEGKVEANYWAAAFDESGKLTKISYFINGTKLATGWQTIEGRRYYFDGNGILKTGFFKVGSNTYYGREAESLEEYPGQVAVGEQEIGGAAYYFGSNYVMSAGWQKIGGAWRYFSTAGTSPERGMEQEVSAPVQEGSWYWYTVNGEKYCFRNNSTLLKGWQTINGKRYYLDPSTGAAVAGKELKIGSYTYYFDADGVMQKDIVANGYGYNANGYRVKGWQTIGGKRYYFDPNTGILRTGDENGLYAIGSNMYYLGQDGALRYGWIRETEGKVYYANTSGALLAGWQKIENLWYYFDRDTRQQDPDARIEDDYFATATDGKVTNTYYFVNGTSLAKGWQTIKGCKYYFDSTTGVLRTGFFQAGKAWYYFHEDRTPMAGWWENPDTGKTYYFNGGGQAVTGWQTIGGGRYYFDANGVMQTQRTLVGKVYYFFGPDGKMRTGFVKYCDTTYYFNGSGQMLKGWQTIGGQRYYFDGEGAMQLGFVKIGSYTYYFDEKRAALGQMLKGEQRIGESTYYFNTSGALLYGWQKVNNQWRFFDLSTGEERETEISASYWVAISMPDCREEKSFINNGTTVLKGWQTVEGKRRYFDSNGFLWTREKGWLTVGGNRFYFNQDGSVYQGFLEEENGDGTESVYYLNTNGQMLKGWQTIKADGSSGKYYLDPFDGKAWTGHKKIGNYWYYLDPEHQGKMATGYLELPENGTVKGYYYNSSGIRQSGWQKVNGEWRYFDPADGTVCDVTVGEDYWAAVTLSNGAVERAFIRNGSTVLKGWQTINGKRYYFDANGFRWTESKGWLTIGSNRFYFDAKKDNSVYQGFLELGDDTYYLNANGQALKGWQTIKAGNDSGKYYLDTSTGEVYMGHQKVGNNWYYFDPENHGRMAVGHIQDTKGDSYYYNTDGKLLTGWRRLPGETDYRYFDAAGDRADGGRIGVERNLEKETTAGVSGKKPCTYRWYTIKDEGCKANGSRYCFLDNSTLLKNRQTIDGKYYWFHSSTGALYTGCFAIGKDCYRSNSDGSVYTGFAPESPESNGDVYYYNEYGQRVTGWQTITVKEGDGENQYKYYFNANGVMLKGICWIGNTQYVFHPQNGRMITDFAEIDGKTHYANTNGTLKTGWQKVYNRDRKVYESYYYGNDGQRTAGWLSISGKLYYFNEEGIMQTGLKENIPAAEGTGEPASYYFNSGGILQKGWFRFAENGNEVWKYFGADGKRTEPVKEQAVSPKGESAENYRWYLVEEAGETDGETAGNWYCIQKNKGVLKGFYNIGTWRYYFDSTTGALRKGSFQAEGAWYYSEPESGAINRSGLLLQEGKGEAGSLTYYDANGKRYAGGWINLEDKNNGEITNRYYFYADTGKAASGFTKIGNYYYYFDPVTKILQKKDKQAVIPGKNTAGEDALYYTGGREYLLSGWQKVDSKWYYFDPVTKEGAEAAEKDNWVTLGGNEYYFIDGKTMAKSRWLTIEKDGISGKYYFNGSGILQKGWVNIGANRYYTEESTGRAFTGMKTFEEGSFAGNTYYFDANGLMKKGWISLAEEDPDTGKTVTKYYYLNANGIMLKGDSWIGNVRYLLHPETGERITSSVEIGGKTYYADSARGKEGRLLLGWRKTGNKTYYYGTDGQRYTGWQLIGGKWYYLNEEGVLQTGLQNNIPAREQEGETASYYFNSSGIMQAGWFRFMENKAYVWKYFGSDGQQVEWQDGKTITPMDETDKNYRWYQIDDDWYCIRKNATLLKGFCNIGTWRYYFDTATGVLRQGDFRIGTAQYHSDPDTGAINRSGLLLTDKAGRLRYYDGNGKLYSGWVNLKSGNVTNRYYFQEGGACSGFSRIGNYNYYFDPDTCALQKDASDIIAGVNPRGREVFYYTGKYEYLLSGWQKIKGTWYYFDPETKEGSIPEKAEDNWITLEGNQYYFIKGTTLARNNWQTIKVNGADGRYYFNSNGVLQKGLFAVGANWYYTDEETGRAEAGFRTFEEGPFKGHTCYFDAKGLMKRGWLSLAEKDPNTGKAITKYYYLNANGILLKGISWIGNILYLLHPETGERITSSVIIDGKNYYGDSTKGKEGRLLLGLQKQGNKTFYYGTDGQRYTGWQEINGDTYYFEENGEMHTGILKLTEMPYTYYFNGNGVMQKGWVRLSENKAYIWRYFGADGREIEPIETSYTSPEGESIVKNPYHWYCIEEPGEEQGTAVRNWYCIYNNTTVLKNCSKIGSWKYLFDARTGVLQKGHFTVGTTAYYSDPDTGAIDPDGLLYTDKDTDERYYYDGNGKRCTGWKTIKGGADAGKYYFHALTGAAYRGGWYYVDNTRYLFDFWGRVKVTPEISAAASNNYKTIAVTWKKVEGAVRYILEYGTDASFTDPEILAIEGDSTLSSEIRGLEPGVRYYFRLKYELDSKIKADIDTPEESIYTSVESVYSAVKSAVPQNELSPTATSASLQKFALATLSDGETGIHAEFTVKGRLKSYGGDANYYLVRVDSYTNKRLSGALYTIPKDEGVQGGSNFKFAVDMPIPKQYAGDTDEDAQGIMSKYALAVKSSSSAYTVISKAAYVTNPGYGAEYQTSYFQAASKKGIQGATSQYSQDLGTKQTLLNLDLKDVLKSGPGGGAVTYKYKGKDYFFSNLSALRGTVTEYNNGGYARDEENKPCGQEISVTLAIMASYRDDYRRELIHPSAREGSPASYYTLNSSTQSGQELYEAMFSYLGEIFGRDDCYVSNWILGNEVNSCNAWNYTGSLSFGEYMKCYAASFRQLYYGVKKTRASSRVFISLDNAWNQAVAGYTGKSVLDTFASCIQAEGADIEWNVAFHPYSAPLTRTDFWNDYSNTSNSTASPFISMRNLNYLTGYLGTVEKKYGKGSGSIRVILSEQGWTSSNCGEYTQATAIAWAYYIAEFNSRVDAFIIRAEMDDWEEMQAGLYMGLKNYASDTKKTSYYVYKYMDSPLGNFKIINANAIGLDKRNVPRFQDAQKILCNTSWGGKVPGFNMSKLNGMPAAYPE